MAPDATYDVFLSYAARDRPAVEELARRLRAAGFKPFFDKWHLVPGKDWQEELEEALARSRTCAVFLGLGHLGPWQNEEMRGALARRVRDQSHSVIPVLLPGAAKATKEGLPPALKRLTWVEFRGGLTDPEAFHRLVCGINGIPPGDGPVPAEPKPPPRAGPPLPVRGSAPLQARQLSRRLLLVLVATILVIITGALLVWWVMLHSRQDKETEVEEAPATSQAAIQAPPKETEVEEAPTTSQAAMPVPAPCITGEQADEGGITWVRICPGTFTMGSAENDPQVRLPEKPAHQVMLSEFWLGKTEVTNKQYRFFQPTRQGEGNLPATVGWIDATAACKRFGGRLPTEAEWEYAARAGSQTAWSFGDDEKHLGEYAWYGEGAAGKPHPVGVKKPNDWGLYDMYGNVWEWVEDWYGPYDGAAQIDPAGPQSGQGRVVRGGSFFVPSRYLRSAVRESSLPLFWVRGLGFRCAHDPRRQP